MIQPLRFGLALIILLTLSTSAYFWLHTGHADAGKMTSGAELNVVDSATDAAQTGTELGKRTGPDAKANTPSKPHHAAAQAKPKLALIDPNLPIDQRIAALEQRANAGDVNASCKLVQAIGKCRKTRIDFEMTNPVVYSSLSYMNLDEQRTNAIADRFAQIQTQQQRILAECARVPDTSRYSTLDDWLRLAQAGDISASLRFIGASASELTANPASYRLYRQHAFAMFQQAFEAGDPYAANVWAYATYYRMYPLGVLLPAEWNTPDVAMALQNRIQQEVSADRTSFGRPPAAEAVAEAERLFQRYFAGSERLKQWRQRHQARADHLNNRSDQNRDPLELLTRTQPGERLDCESWQ